MGHTDNTLALNGQEINHVPIGRMLKEMMKEIPFPYKIDISVEPLLNRISKSDQSNELDSVKVSQIMQLEKKIRESDGNIETLSKNLEKEFEALFSMLYPDGVNFGTLGLICEPFTGTLIYSSTEFERVFFDDNMETPMQPETPEDKVKWRIIEAGVLILSKCYDQDLKPLVQPIISLRNRQNKLEQHYKMEFITSAIDVIELKPKKKLSQAQIQELLTNLDDPELWLNYLPPENFALKGLLFLRMTDVTPIEINSRLRAIVLQNDAANKTLGLLPQIINGIRSFLNMPELQAGFLSQKMPLDFDSKPPLSILSNTGISFGEILVNSKYHQSAIETKHHLVISDLKKEPSLGPVEKAMLKKGIQSIIFIPLINGQGDVLGVLEVASPEPNQLNDIHVFKLHGIRSLLTFGIERSLQSFDQRVDLILQRHFTSIHPSVEWKFKEIASKLYLNQINSDSNQNVEPIVFNDIHPLYGQADIVGSSTMRNNAIQADLLLNLELVMDVLQATKEHMNYNLLDAYMLTVEQLRSELMNNYVSSHESQVVDFLTIEVHPFLREICQVPNNKIQSQVDRYFSELDDDLHIIYRDRKDYEESVSMLNHRMGSLLEKSNDEMQKTLPHFFEHFKTDGVEYNIYVGKSISPTYPFSSFQLKNIRLWQLVNLCEITQLVHSMQGEMPVPLQTAQLIFVYNNSLSIRFRMDEKQFDVDGAYNVRYEIIKKRIDKSVIKGTNERLTLKGKIAIVYLQEKDRKEYLDYLDYLLKRGYITEDIEDLDLEKLQGVEGLRALRVTVKTDPVSTEN